MCLLLGQRYITANLMHRTRSHNLDSQVLVKDIAIICYIGQTTLLLAATEGVLERLTDKIRTVKPREQLVMR